MNVTTAKAWSTAHGIFPNSHIIELWLQRQASPHTRGCYRRDASGLLAHAAKPLIRLTLGDLQSFAQSLVQDGLAPVSRARTLAAVKCVVWFCRVYEKDPDPPFPGRQFVYAT
jgi:site-specific recombinase XerD